MTHETAAATLRSTLPEGVVTFLFSDIEGSTRLLEQHRQAMGSALARHHAILEAAVGEHDGVVFETVGDAVYGAFADPLRALTAAVAIQRRLRAEDWGAIEALRVRIAVHTGAVEARGRHYYGPALFECSRLQSLAHGGQTLASAATAALVSTAPPEGVALRSLGEHRLEDIERPLEVLQVEAEDLPLEFPPLRTPETRSTNLPHELTSFVGREGEMRRVAELLGEQRLVTLLGPGGTGKTRLAIEAAGRQLDRFPDGVWLVELAPVQAPELVLAELADTWHLRAGEGRSLDEVVRLYLRRREALLVLDNCEHVRAAAAELVADVLRSASGIRVLATSRESLGVAGEQELRLGPLPVPDADEPESDAVRLFLDRARAARHDFAASGEDRSAIAEICRRVEGMPLAIELAAARVRSLSPIDLARRLETSFGALGSGPKTAQPRQRTLQATLDWSYELLEPVEQALLRELSVFAGTFDVAAVEAIAAQPAGADETLERLDSLVDKSLLLAVPGPSVRFRLLEPIRQYAAGHLDRTADARRVRDAHARYYAGFVALASPYTRGPEQMAWERRIDAEYDNVRVALSHLLEHGQVERYLTVGFDLFVYWMHLAMQVEGMSTLLAGLERADDDTDITVRLKAWFVFASLGAEITDASAIPYARRGLELARSSGDPRLIGRMEWALGATICHATTDPEGRSHLREAIRLLDGDPQPYWWEPEWERGLFDLNLVSYLPPDDELAPVRVRRALATFEELGDQAMLAAALEGSQVLWGQADEGWLLENLYRSADILSGMRVPFWYGHVLLSLGATQGRRGDHDAASANLAEGARHLQEMGDLNCWAISTRRKAMADAARDRMDDAMAGLAEVIESLPDLPMSEFHGPVCLDAATEILLADGRPDDAAFALGAARSLEVPNMHPAFRREPLHEAWQDQLDERLGAEVTAARMAAGAEDIDAALATVLGWLRA